MLIYINLHKGQLLCIYIPGYHLPVIYIQVIFPKPELSHMKKQLLFFFKSQKYILIPKVGNLPES